MKTCKGCKKEFEPRRRNGIAASRCDKCIIAREREKKKKAMQRAKENRKKARERKKNSVATLKKVLDQVFSQYIRQRDKGVCVTCGTKKPWKEQQNGHYVPRGHNATRFDERNCNCQCIGCNVFKKGNMDEYTLFMIRKHGVEVLEELNKLKYKTKQFTSQELQEMIDHYKHELTKF